MKPLVSVVIPVYNGEKYVAKAIKSVLNQTYTHLELIIIDDGSQDRTSDIVSSIKDKRIKYYYQKNGGEASARNLGLRMSNSELIAFLDADDLYRQDKLERQVQALRENADCGFTYCSVDIIDADDHKCYSIDADVDFKHRQDMLAYLLYRQFMPATASMMIKRECLNEDVYYSEQYTHAVDYFFSIRLLMNTKGCYQEDRLYQYRRHGENLTNNHMKQKLCENSIVRELGVERIAEIVNESFFDKQEKVLLLSKIYYKVGLTELSRNHLSNIHRDKWDFEFHFHAGVCAYSDGEYEEAAQYFKVALLIDAQKPEAFNNLGCCKMKLGMVNEATERFKMAYDLNKDYIDPQQNLVSVSLNGQEMRLTERVLRKSLTKY
ncbi:glycosyltransferase family 2 protein [Anoxynatronum buryatiense]|uniref:Glycosyltransferase involved in cell wall bisynthesis n=1 Tax=Anoxynatronum buryatiense TaxID=489973 RepID=A0AA45WY69_9CLOT|nr:glycosyltransferase [Anoxynatronum buryatiense]SMP67506.1 Glycosyltransferase involved in cell wall bisynthesis [Anoxynatronum buryatiense]